MENFAQNYVKFDIFGTFLFKKGVNPKFQVAALPGGPGVRPPALAKKSVRNGRKSRQHLEVSRGLPSSSAVWMSDMLHLQLLHFNRRTFLTLGS